MPSGASLLLAAILLFQFMDQTICKEDPTARKVGAGLLLCSSGNVLLLRRNSKHNDNSWTVPGGNLEAGDSSLLGTATREAMEELGQVPPFQIRSQILTKRGKQEQKQFTIFVADLDPAVVKSFAPKLSKESREWKWVPWSDVQAAAAAAGSNAGLQLHPVVAVLASKHAKEVLSATQACPAAAAASGH